MDQVLADTLTANLKSAHTAEERTNALTLAMIALVDCQRKTADRVKELHASREKVAWLIRVVQGFAAAGGFAAIVKLMKVWGML
jgi:hypothetical protein